VCVGESVLLVAICTVHAVIHEYNSNQPGNTVAANECVRPSSSAAVRGVSECSPRSQYFDLKIQYVVEVETARERG